MKQLTGIIIVSILLASAQVAVADAKGIVLTNLIPGESESAKFFPGFKPIKEVSAFIDKSN